MPPLDACLLMAKLHALIGSTAAGEAENAREKLVKLLAKHAVTWNDLPEILAVGTSGSAASNDGSGTPMARGAEWGEPFRSPDGTAYVDIRVNGHRETWAVRSRGFANHVRFLVFRQTNQSAPNGLVRQIADQLEAEAQFGGRQRDVHLRVGEYGGHIYLDLADDEWRVVEVTPKGWRIVGDAPVRFRRVPGMLPLPLPKRGGSVEELRPLINVQNPDELVLIIAWLLGALRAGGPHPILAISGEHGSAKSALMEALRLLIDPHEALLRSLSGKELDLFVGAEDNYAMAFDNVSAISPAISDALCRLATGGAYATRKLFKNKGESFIQAIRPIMINGISSPINRGDLADRTIFVGLKPIQDISRRTKKHFLADLQSARPRILGMLLDAASHGLRQTPNTRLPGLSRMADFELWVTACECALWPSGTFSKAYAANRQKVIDETLGSDSVMAAIVNMTATDGPWVGTAADLLRNLERCIDERQRKGDRNWPRGPEALRRRLDRAAPHLRREGIEISYSRAPDRARTRLIEISPSEPPATVQTGQTVRSNQAA